MTCRPTAAMQRGASMAQRERSLTRHSLFNVWKLGLYVSAVMTIIIVLNTLHFIAAVINC